MKRVSMRGCWGQPGPFLTLRCLAPGSAARRQSRLCPQWCLAQRAMPEQAACLPVAGVHPCVPPGAGWHCQPSLFSCFLVSEKKVFNPGCSRGGGGGHMAHGSFSLCWPEGKGEKKNCLCSPVFVSPFPSMRESQVVSQRSSVQRGDHGVPAETERRVSQRQILQLAGDSRQQDLKTELKIGC